MEAPHISEEDMQLIYNWVDEIPLSRPKRNIARDFSDGGKHRLAQQCSSPSSGDCEALPASPSGAAQLQRSALSVPKDLQLEHPESKTLQEDRIHFMQEGYRGRCQLRARYDRAHLARAPSVSRLLLRAQVKEGLCSRARRSNAYVCTIVKRGAW